MPMQQLQMIEVKKSYEPVETVDIDKIRFNVLFKMIDNSNICGIYGSADGTRRHIFRSLQSDLISRQSDSISRFGDLLSRFGDF